MRFQFSFLMMGMAATALLSAACPAMAQDASVPVDFSADSLQHDDATNTVTARGNVELSQGGRILKADEIVYSVDQDAVTARGNVVLLETTGDVYFAEEVAFTDQMRDGYVKALKATMADGSRFWAKEGERKAGTKTTMTDAGYTPCEPCKNDPGADPAWQILAGEVHHDQDLQRISYHDARMELWGVPVLYTPYFSHPDGTVKQKSGFLTPSVGYDSDLGLMLTNSYYFALSPHYDATLGVTAMTQHGPLLSGEYRHRFENASLETSGSVTRSSRTDDVGETDVRQDDEWRGHMFAEGLWNIDDQWRAGMELEIASDDQYLRQYDFSNKDVLENEIFLERFSGRNYAVSRVLAFQDLRIATERTDQPDIFPEVNASFLGDPGQTLGGRWGLDFSALNLRREAGGQDMTRMVGQAGWQRRLVSDFGLVNTVDLKARGDVYYTHDRDVAPAGSGRSGDGSEVRGFAQAHMVSSYPLVKPLEKADIVIEPIAALTLAPSIHAETGNIPNEDSQDVQVDASNLFEANRFPGLDRIEDNSRATYGIRTGVHGHEGSRAEIFVGQSHRFDSLGDDNPFPGGSGLAEKKSDLVGQITASYKNRFSLDYRFQLDEHDLSSRRHEVEAHVTAGRVELASRYLYARSLEGTNQDETREQIQAGVSYRATDAWRVRSSITQDLGDDPGMRKADLGLDYTGQCLTFSGTLERNLARDSSGESSTEIMFRMGFRNIGEFSTSGISLASDDRDDDEAAAPPGP